MHTGTAGHDPLSQVLRNISQRRRHGVLEVRLTEKSIRLSFWQGKVVDAQEEGRSGPAEVLESLIAADLVPEGFRSPLTSYAALRAALRADTRTSARITDAVFQRAVQQHVIGLLYSLNPDAPALTGFDSSMVEYEREFAPSVSIGQLLLDHVAMQTDRARFLGIFSGNVVIARGVETAPGLSNEESVIFEILPEPRSLGEVRRLSLFSEFALQESLLRMYENGIVRVSEAPKQMEATPLFNDDVLSNLDSAIDDVFEAEGIQSSAAETSEEPLVDTSEKDAKPLAVERTDISRQSLVSSGVKQRVALTSSRAMHMHWIVAGVMVIFLLAVVLVPLYLWQPLYEAFAG